MTRNVVDVIKENQSVPQITEKAQIMVQFSAGSHIIFRFNSLKKAEKEYKVLAAAWKKVGPGKQVHDVDGDMFIGTVDLYSITNICFTDIAKRMKFVPFTG